MPHRVTVLHLLPTGGFVPLPSLAGAVRAPHAGRAPAGPGVTAGSASGTSSPPAQEEGDGTADASTGVPASMVGQQR